MACNLIGSSGHQEQAITLGSTIELSTFRTYSSALTSYLTFIRLHQLLVESTEETLSFFVVYMSHHIEPRLVRSYLSGIVQQLETVFPSIKAACHSTLITRTMDGCLKLLSSPICRRSPLTLSHLHTVITHYHTSPPSHDDLLFVAMLFTGFFALLRLRKMVFPDDVQTREWWKVT